MNKPTKQKIISVANMIGLARLYIPSSCYDPMGHKWHPLPRNREIKAKIIAALEVSVDCLDMLEKAGCGQSGHSNTLRGMIAEIVESRDKAEAALAKAEPVLKAIREAEIVRSWEHGEEIGTGKLRFDYHAMDDILEAALKYREEEAKNAKD